MKISRQNLQKEGYLAPKTEYCEIRQEACILSSSNGTGMQSLETKFVFQTGKW